MTAQIDCFSSYYNEDNIGELHCQFITSGNINGNPLSILGINCRSIRKNLDSILT